MTGPSRAWRIAAILTFPLLIVFFALRYVTDPYRYIYLLREDGPVEWLTFAFLALAGLIALDIGFQLFRTQRTFHWFFFAFGAFCLVMGMEEISWGQRVFAITPPEFFLGNSDQQEINVHNVLQQKLDFKTKDLAALVLSIYGIAMPLLALNKRFAALLARFRLIVPPLYLSIGFLTATLLMFDIPSGFEEEIGEFLFGLSFLFFMLHELAARDTIRSDVDASRVDHPGWLIKFDRLGVIAITLLAFGLHVWQLDAKGIWLPEAITAAAAHVSPFDMIRHTWTYDSFEMPGWLLIAGIWQFVTGIEPFALRLLPAMAATAAAPLLWVTLKIIWPDQVALRLLSAFFIAISPAMHFYGQDLSPYAMLATLSILSLYLLIAATIRKSRWPLVAWVIVVWVMTFLHLTAFAVVLAEAAILAWLSVRASNRRRRSVYRDVLIIALLPALLWLFTPGVRTAIASAAHIADPEDWSYAGRLQQLWKDLFFGSPIWQSYRARLSVVTVPMVLCGAFALLALRQSEWLGEIRVTPKRLAWLLLSPIILALSGALFVLPAINSATLMIILPSLIILAVLGMIYLWNSVRLVGAAAILLALIPAITGLIAYADAGYAKSDYLAMTQMLEAEMAAEDGLLLMAPSQHFLADHYLADADAQTVPSTELSPFWPTPVDPLVPERVDGEIQEALAMHPALWLAIYDDESVDPGRFLQPYLTAVSYRDNCIEWRDVELCRYVSADFVEPSVQRAPEALYADELSLEAVSLAGQATTIWNMPAILAELHWTASTQPSRDYKVSLRLLDGAGQAVAQRDDFPIGPLLPPTTWAAGDEKPGFFLLPLPADLPSGEYSLHVVVYDPNDMSIATYQTPDGAQTDAPLELAEVAIDENGKIGLH